MLGLLVVLDVLAAQLLKVFPDSLNLRQLEKSYRVASSIYHHDLLPGVDETAVWGPFRYPYRTNSLGFRDREARDVPLSSEQRRVLFIGDSFTEGPGFAFEQTFVGRISEVLEQHGIEVLNAAVFSYSPIIYHRKIQYLLEERGLRFDLLIVFIDISDIHDEAEYYRLDDVGNVVSTAKARKDFDVFVPRQTLGRRLKLAFKDNSLIVRFGDALKDTIRLMIKCPEPIACMTGSPRAMWTVDEETFRKYGALGLRRAAAAMDRLASLAGRHDIAMTVVVYPWPEQIMRQDLESRQVSFWRVWAAQRGVDFVNLFPVFIDGDDPLERVKRYYIEGDTHWNAEGHALVARALLERVDFSR